MLNIAPLGMAAADLENINAAVEGAKARGDCVLRYWSEGRLTLWLGLMMGGQLASWLMVPCPTRGDFERLSSFWVEIVAEGLRTAEVDVGSGTSAIIEAAKGGRGSVH